VIGVVLAIVAVALSAVILAWLIGKAVTAWQRRKHRLRPQGAPRAIAEREGAWVEGTVRAQRTIGSFSGERDCVAWGVTALADEHRGGPVLLRDGRTEAFIVALDDGRTVEVPAGRARVWSVGEAPEAARETVEGDALRGLLGPIARGEDEYDVLAPAERAESVLILPGDRVRLFAALTPVASEGGGYREGPSTLRVSGVPRLARVG
jgi:hypothetical protein